MEKETCIQATAEVLVRRGVHWQQYRDLLSQHYVEQENMPGGQWSAQRYEDLRQQRRHKAALYIQTVWRGRVARRQQRRHKAALAIQTVWRGRMARRLAENRSKEMALRNKAAIIIQVIMDHQELKC